jgi:hypothetical protein
MPLSYFQLEIVNQLLSITLGDVPENADAKFS